MRLDIHNHRTKIVIGLVVTGLIFASYFIFWFIFLSPPETFVDSNRSGNDQSTSATQINAAADIPNTLRDLAAVVDLKKPAFVSKDDLLKICDIPNWPRKYESWEFFNELKLLVSTECKEAFDVYLRHHHNFGGQNGIFQLISIANSMSYHRIFFDPIGDRDLVFDALSKEECRFNDTDTVKWELKEACHASAFANHMQFLRLCTPSGSLPIVRLFDDLERLERARNDQMHPLNAHLTTDIEGWANNLWIRYLERSWIYTECNKYSDDVRTIAIYKDQESQEYKWLHGVATRLGEDTRWGDVTHGPVLNVLHSIAARFGDEWAMTTYMPSQSTREEWWSKMHQHHPWDDLWNTFVKHKTVGLPRLKDGIELVLSLQDSNIKFDWDWLVLNLCSRGEEHMRSNQETTCQSMLTQLYKEVDLSDSRRLHILDRIETLALELQVYN